MTTDYTFNKYQRFLGYVYYCYGTTIYYLTGWFLIRCLLRYDNKFLNFIWRQVGYCRHPYYEIPMQERAINNQRN